MMVKVLNLLALLLLSIACGSNGPETPMRSIASVVEREETLLQDIEDKLIQIHLYHVIGQNQLMLFDEQIESTELDQLYQRPVYLKLQAVRTQVEEVEYKIIEIMDELKVDSKSKASGKKRQAILTMIDNFAEKSRIHSYSMENLKSHLDVIINKDLKALTKSDIEKEITSLRASTQYQVFEQNIEHLSFMLESRTSETSKRFYPSTTKSGNITGNEFPSKVWSLTFDNGPKPQTSSQILSDLKRNKLKATFFQLTKHAKTNSVIANKIRFAGMDIASHSFSHQQLTKIGANALEKEITIAVKELKKVYETDISFFRLPYGAGVSTPHIREKIAANGLIHVLWNVDSLDWMPQSPEKIITRTKALMKKTTKDSGILLFHDIHMRTAKALPEIINYLKEDNRRVCTLKEIVTQMNEESKTVCLQK